MRYLSLFSGGGGFDLGLERAGMQCVGQIEIMPYALRVLKKHWPKVPKHTDILTFCARDGLAKTIQSQVKERALKAKNQDSGKKWQDAYEYLIQAGLLERMFQGFYPSMTEKIFSQLSPSCRKSGMAFRGEYLTVNTSECPNDAVESTLSDVLESHAPPQYYLRKKAVEGIIRRSKNGACRGMCFYKRWEKTRPHA